LIRRTAGDKIEAQVRVRVFVRPQQWLAGHAELSRRLDELEDKYDAQFKVVFDTIRQLVDTTPPPKRKAIGFHVKEGRPIFRIRRVRRAK